MLIAFEFGHSIFSIFFRSFVSSKNPRSGKFPEFSKIRIQAENQKCWKKTERKGINLIVFPWRQICQSDVQTNIRCNNGVCLLFLFFRQFRNGNFDSDAHWSFIDFFRTSCVVSYILAFVVSRLSVGGHLDYNWLCLDNTSEICNFHFGTTHQLQNIYTYIYSFFQIFIVQLWAGLKPTQIRKQGFWSTEIGLFCEQEIFTARIGVQVSGIIRSWKGGRVEKPPK